jgi:hypothetical protein
MRVDKMKVYLEKKRIKCCYGLLLALRQSRRRDRCPNIFILPMNGQCTRELISKGLKNVGQVVVKVANSVCCISAGGEHHSCSPRTGFEDLCLFPLLDQTCFDRFILVLAMLDSMLVPSRLVGSRGKCETQTRCSSSPGFQFREYVGGSQWTVWRHS